MNTNLRRALLAAALALAGTGTALAHSVVNGQLTANCDGFSASVGGKFLDPIAYTVEFTVTISGCVASPITQTLTAPMVHDAANSTLGTASVNGTWPATLDGVCVVSGSAHLVGYSNPGATTPLVTSPSPLQFKCVPPDVKGICHNIGGPRDLGANCDSNNQCTIVLQDGSTVTTDGDKFFGIIIKASPKATRAHIRHGDGPLLMTFDPPLHLASEIGPHQASNVECLGERVNTQPPEPGN